MLSLLPSLRAVALVCRPSSQGRRKYPVCQGRYINATAMCQVAGKQWSHYRQLQTTQAFLDELAGSTGIPVDLLTHTVTRGPNHECGTGVHPRVAVNRCY